MTEEEKEEILNNPLHRTEQYYKGILDGDTSELPEPIHREEVYLEAIAENGGGGGGGGGTKVVPNPSAEATDELEKIQIGSKVYSLPEGGGSGALEQAITASVNVGGIKSGDQLPVGKTFQSIFQDMLNPVAYPVLTNPSATLSATGSKLLEVGASLSVTFTLAFNRGSINPAYGTSGYRSGAAENYTFDGDTQLSNTFVRTVTGAKTSYQGSVAYAAGEQPKDSAGNNYQSPLPAGSVNSNTISYEFVNAIWANVSSISTIAKQALVSKSAKQKDFNFPAQTVANPEVFDIPANWNVTAVQVKNDLSGAYEDALSQFTVTDVNHDDAGGNSTAYKRYTFNMGFDTGARSVRVKWS